ncbi:MAG TPA: hypothetical protein PK993_04245 [Clostridia bacterium]|nr:hypothetical protein [Clostridia bacterium]
MSFREVRDDIFRDWLDYREGTELAFTNSEDKKHVILFDEICENILNNVSGSNYEYIQKQLNKLDDNFMDYVGYWNEKYYRNGFCDGLELIIGCLNK